MYRLMSWEPDGIGNAGGSVITCDYLGRVLVESFVHVGGAGEASFNSVAGVLPSRLVILCRHSDSSPSRDSEALCCRVLPVDYRDS